MPKVDIQSIKQRFGIIGNSELLNRCIDIAVQVASTDLSVLVTGESGVGKENFPQIIHQYSYRKHGPYIAVNCGETSFTVEATYWPDLTVEYDAVDSVEYRTEDTPGVRTGGFGSARLMMGNFRNEEFGNYTRYSYTGRGPCVVVTSEEKILVLGGRNVEETERIYQTLLEKIQ